MAEYPVDGTKIKYICRMCRKLGEKFHTIEYFTLTGWCSEECFVKEGKESQDTAKKELEKVLLRTHRSGF